MTAKNIKENTKDATIIFYRSTNNIEETAITQQQFLDTCRNRLANAQIIDYISDDRLLAPIITDLIIKQSTKFKIIINSSLSKKEYDRQYNMYDFFDWLPSGKMVELYLMDSHGKLYKRVKSLR